MSLRKRDGRSGPRWSSLWASKQTNTASPTRLTCEHKPRPYRGMNDLFSHGFASEIIEPVAGAMRRDQDIWIDFLECFNCLADVVVAERRHDMEAPDDGVHLVDAGYFLSLLDGVNHAAMAARCQNDQPL